MTAKDLKNALLQEAIQGKLCHSDDANRHSRPDRESQKEDANCHPELDSGSHLLKQLKNEMLKRVQHDGSGKGKLKKQKPLPPVTDQEKPFEIPDNWCWCRLGEVCEINPRNHIEDNLEVGFIPMALIQDEYQNKHSFETKKWKDIKSGFTHFKNGDVIVAKITPCFQNRKSALVQNLPNDFGAGTTELHVFRNISELMEMKYILYFCKSALFINEGVKNFTGTAGQQRISSDFIKNFPFPLPPLSEQKQIVAAIEKVLPLIELYGQKEQELTFINSKIASLTKKAILQEAVQGKLCHSDDANRHSRPDKEFTKDDANCHPELDSGSHLLKQIKTEMLKRVQHDGLGKGKLKKEKPLPPVTDEEKPFEIPDNWCWCRLGEIGEWKSGSTPTRDNSDYYGGNIPWLKTGDLNDGIITNIPEFITQKALDDCSLKLNPKGSVLIAMYGATIGKLGILDIEATTNQACCACICYEGIYNKYLFYYLMQQKSEFTKKAEGGAQPNISREKIINHVFPLPPLSEQKQIVLAVEKLLALADKLIIKN